MSHFYPTLAPVNINNINSLLCYSLCLEGSSNQTHIKAILTSFLRYVDMLDSGIKWIAVKKYFNTIFSHRFWGDWEWEKRALCLSALHEAVYDEDASSFWRTDAVAGFKSIIEEEKKWYKNHTSKYVLFWCWFSLVFLFLGMFLSGQRWSSSCFTLSERKRNMYFFLRD